MIVLDENVYQDQRAVLRRWGIRLCHIGHDVGRQGMQDYEIIPLLRTLRKPTLVSRDDDFFDKKLCSDRFCLAYLDVPPNQVAEYARRLLRHPEFKTWAQRKGRVLRVAPSGISVWQIHIARIKRCGWNN